MAKNPWLHLSVGLFLSVGLSTIGFMFGNFSASADNAGWDSRGTLIADRHSQVLLTTENEATLSTGDGDTWDDLINNVQPGLIEGEEDEDDTEEDATTRRLSLALLGRKLTRSNPILSAEDNRVPFEMASNRRALQVNLGSCDGDR